MTRCSTPCPCGGGTSSNDFIDCFGDIDRRLLKWRTRQTLLLTAISLCAYPLQFLTQLWEPALMILSLAGFVTSLCIMFTLFDLRRIFRDDARELPQ